MLRRRVGVRCGCFEKGLGWIWEGREWDWDCLRILYGGKGDFGNGGLEGGELGLVGGFWEFL